MCITRWIRLPTSIPRTHISYLRHKCDLQGFCDSLAGFDAQNTIKFEVFTLTQFSGPLHHPVQVIQHLGYLFRLLMVILVKRKSYIRSFEFTPRVSLYQSPKAKMIREATSLTPLSVSSYNLYRLDDLWPS